MAVSKRLRMEILRRDNHTCRYCGAAAPDARLTIDHVVPVTLGGTDDPSNLVAACADCNAGKSSVPTDAAMVADVGRDALRWSAALTVAAGAARADFVARGERQAAFYTLWKLYAPSFGYRRGEPWPLPDRWHDTLERFYDAGAEEWMPRDAMDITMSARREDYWKYLCGVMWRKIADLQDAARDVLAVEGD